MQRYHAGSCTSAVNNNTIGGPSARDIGRIDSSSLPPNFPVSSRKLEMSVTENPKKTDAPPIVKLNKALKLAEVWVKNMSGSAGDETTNVDTEGRPQRLGLGAKVPRQSNVVLSDDPVERRLHSKLAAEKRKAANIAKDEGTNSCGVLDDDDEDNEDESRTNAFVKRKAPAPVTLSIPGNKKQK